MATPYKLASGRWGIRVHMYVDENGRPHQKKFSADTKKEVLALAREFEFNRDRLAHGRLTVAECVQRYIDKKRPVASPSTITGYEYIFRVEFSEDPPITEKEKGAREKRRVRIGSVQLAALDSDKVQDWVNDLAGVVSSKTVRNIYGLFISAVTAADPAVRLQVTLPQAVRGEIRVPTSAEIRLLLQLSEGSPLHLAIELAAFASLRAGEIAALCRSDLVGDKLIIKRSMARSGVGGKVRWVIKEPKTTDSRRVIPCPSFMREEILAGPDRVVDLTPLQISSAYRRLVARSGLEHTRFHDLRHYFASFHHAAGTPDQYIMEWGGWSSDWTLKEIYRNTLADEREKIAERMDTLFTNIARG